MSDLAWGAIALGDVSWIAIAFIFGFIFRVALGLPPLVGFLAAGFLLNYLGFSGGGVLEKISDLGITLLLFSIGLKLDLRSLMRPQVWAVTSLHILLIVSLFSPLVLALSATGISLFAGLGLNSALVLAFAMSFSSTVFVVKVLDEQGEMGSLSGGIAIGVLIVQDLAAVLFMAASSGKLPSPWALLLLGLPLLRPLLHQMLRWAGHGELLVLYGLFLAVGGAELFEAVDIKADLGALVAGLLLAGNAKSDEVAKTMLGFKDLFLVGFFLSVGMAGQPTMETMVAGLLLLPLLSVKSLLFFFLFTGFRLRARTALLATLNLSNYSEFGLIVTAVGVSMGLLAPDWLLVMAIMLSLSFLIAAPLNAQKERIYGRWPDLWRRMQRRERLPGDDLVDIGDAEVVIFGMGRIGTGAYEWLREQGQQRMVGVDSDPSVVAAHQAAGRRVIVGDATDDDFWDRCHDQRAMRLIMLALPGIDECLVAIRLLRKRSFLWRIAAIAKYPDHEERLRAGGADAVFNVYQEAGAGFAGEATAVAEMGLLGDRRDG